LHRGDGLLTIIAIFAAARRMLKDTLCHTTARLMLLQERINELSHLTGAAEVRKDKLLL
jgi:hypothetical protein